MHRPGWGVLLTFVLLGCGAQIEDDGAPLDADGTADGDSAPVDADSALVDGDADEIIACIADNPPAEPFDLGDVSLPSRAPGSAGPAAEPPTPASIASQCVVNGGTGCDATRFISKAAASCLAELDEFEAGLRPWGFGLLYSTRQDRVVWTVANLMNDDIRGEGYWGNNLIIDATDGRVLERLVYTAVE